MGEPTALPSTLAPDLLLLQPLLPKLAAVLPPSTLAPSSLHLTCVLLCFTLPLLQVVDLYNRCISERPEERPTAAELLTALAPLL